MTTDVLSQPAIKSGMTRAQAQQLDQYSLRKMLGIWALVTLPMGLLVKVVAPALVPHILLPAGITYWLLIIAGNLTYIWPARLFRSNWMAIIVHSPELIPTLVMVLAVILGLVTA